MTLDQVPNEPAGRLYEVLRAVHGVSGGRTVSAVWEEVAGVLSPARGDGISARAEAGALFHAVELAVAALPDPMFRESFAHYRREWAKPIFAIGMTDSVNHHLSGSKMVSIDAIHTLGMLSSTLRSHTPEPRPVRGAQGLDERLDAIYDTLGKIHMELSVSDWLDARARGRILQLVTASMEDIVFVRFRGFGRIERDVLTLEGELVAAEAQLKVPGSVPEQARSGWLERVSSWLSRVRPIVTDIRAVIEYDAIPPAIAVTTYLESNNIAIALGAWASARVLLEGQHQAPAVQSGAERKELPGSDEEQPDQDAQN